MLFLNGVHSMYLSRCWTAVVGAVHGNRFGCSTISITTSLFDRSSERRIYSTAYLKNDTLYRASTNRWCSERQRSRQSCHVDRGLRSSSWLLIEPAPSILFTSFLKVASIDLRSTRSYDTKSSRLKTKVRKDEIGDVADVENCQSNQVETMSCDENLTRDETCVTTSTSQNKERSSISRLVSDLRRDRVLTVPNVLTLLRMLASPVLGYLVLCESYNMACVVFVIAGFTDVLDGYIARHFPSQTSELGSFIDPLADKFLVSILFVTLTVVDLIPLALTALVITRDVCLTTAGFYVRYISLSPRPISVALLLITSVWGSYSSLLGRAKSTLRQFFDLTNRSAQLKPTTISKINTGIQLSLVAVTLAAPVFGFIDHPALQALWYVTATTTLVSGIGYIFAKDTFKLIQKSRHK